MKAHKKLTLALAGALATLALASIGWAAIPDSSSVIHGCYKKDTGALRVYDPTTNVPEKCARPRRRRSTGTSRAASRMRTSTTRPALALVTDTSWPGTVVSSRSVPAGSYMFLANLVLKGLYNSYPSGTTACQLVARDNLTNYEYWVNGRGTYPANGFTPLALSVARTFGADGGTIAVRCISPVQTQVESVYINALSIGQIHY